MGTVGERLKALRESRGLTLEAAGKIADTTKQSTSQIEKGITKLPGGLPLYLWAKHYGVSLEWLITGRGAKVQAASQPQRLTGATILAAYREAVEKYESVGRNATSFKPLSNPDHADLLALAVIAQLSPDEGGIQVNAEVGRGAKRKGQAGSGSSGEDRPAGTRGESEAAPRKRKDRAA